MAKKIKKSLDNKIQCDKMHLNSTLKERKKK
jgi:hypothetical protein